MTKSRLAVAGLLVFLAVPLQAQYPRARPGQFEVRGMDFSPNGVWRARAEQIRYRRRQLLQSGSISALNATSPIGLSGTAVTGHFVVPVLPIAFSNRALAFPISSYQSALFHGAATPGYSIKTFYEQLSNGNITMDGTVFRAITMDTTDTYFEDGCNGVGVNNSCPHGGQRFVEMLTTTLDSISRSADSTTVWSAFDNDGPDGIPNSGDDDGVVDMVGFIQADVDGACLTPHIWAHRFSYAGWTGSPYVTRTPWVGHAGQFLKVNDYTIQSAVGGATACTPSEIMPIGTLAHEFGHGFGLPDLYDTDQSSPSEGIGEWGLMGAGNYARPYSPSRMSAWSMLELGWVGVDTAVWNQSYQLQPVSQTHRVLYLPIAGSSEYYLVENRQSLESDTAQMSSGFGTHRKAPGLLVWRIDPDQIDAHGFHRDNRVNAGPVHGVELLQADGLGQLDLTGAGQNRGDLGDSYPGHAVGMTPNRRISATTNPALLDTRGQFVGFIIDSINEVTPGLAGPVAFRVVQRPNSLVAPDQTAAQIKVNGQSFARYDDILAPGDTLVISADSAQTANSGRSHLVFQSWSNGGARSQTLVSGATPDTLTAHFSAEHQLIFAANGIGAVTAALTTGGSSVADSTFLSAGTQVTLAAVAPSGASFSGWTGDTTSASSSIELPMGHPYRLVANFTSGVTVTVDQAANALMGKGTLAANQVSFLDQLGNHNGTYDLGDFLAFLRATGVQASPAVMQQVLGQAAAAPATAAATRPATGGVGRRRSPAGGGK